MQQYSFQVRTGQDFAVVDITDRVAQWVTDRGDGLLNVLAPHATAGLALLETGSGTEADAQTALEAILPRDNRWVHRHGSPGHGADHVLPLLVSSTLTLPVTGGRLDLGTWQSIALVDPNVDNAVRTVRLSFLSS
ncbi:MAG: YjbQ family protein [Pseudonocardiaceae bacterium]